MVELEKKVQDNNAVYLSTSQLDWIQATNGDTVIVKDDDGKHGRFLSIWKKR